MEKEINRKTWKNIKKISRRGKWAFLDKNNKGEPISYKERVRRAAEYLKNTILTEDFKRRIFIFEPLAPTLSILKKNGYNDFCSAINHRKIKYNDILLDLGLIINVDKKKWGSLDIDEDGKQLSYKARVKQAAEHLKNKILTEEFYKRYNLKDNESPKLNKLRIEHSSFVNAIIDRGILYNDILRELGFKLNLDTSKWRFLDVDEEGEPLHYNEQVKAAAEYSKINISTDNSLSVSGLKNTNCYDFYRAINRRKIHFNDILRERGLDINTERGKWQFLDIDDDGNPLTYKNQIELAAKHFNNYIYTDAFKSENNLSKNQSPVISKLQEQYGDFVAALLYRNISYNDILNYLELDINYEAGRWSFLDFDSEGNSLFYDEKLDVATKFFTKKILTYEFRKRFNLDDTQTPTVEMLRDYGYNDFIAAIIRRNIYYNDIIETLGLIPNDPFEFQDVGNNLHIILERIYLQHTRNEGCFSFYEVYTNIKTKNRYEGDSLEDKRLKHCDNCSVVEKNFLELSPQMETHFNRSHTKKLVIIDYFLGNSKSSIMEHGRRGYQGRFKDLILIPIHSSDPQKTPIGMPFSENVFVLDPKTFCDYIGLRGDLKYEFLECIKLAKDSLWKKDGSKDILEQKAARNLQMIKQRLDFGQLELEKYINDPNTDLTNDILKYNIDSTLDLTLDFWTKCKGT